MIAAALTWLHAHIEQQGEVYADPDGDGDWLVHPKGHDRVHREARKRRVRTHGFDDVTSFAEWLNRHAKPEDCDVLVAHRGISAGLSPQKAEQDSVTCGLVLHPRAQRWSDVLGAKLTQKDLYKLIVATADDDFKPIRSDAGEDREAPHRQERGVPG